MNKEIFTNSREKLYEQVRKELFALEVEHDEHILLTYFVFPAFELQTFIIAVVKIQSEGNLKLKIKHWDRKNDFYRFNLGIYNIDRLRIFENIIHLNAEENKKLNSYFNVLDSVELPDSLDGPGIVLDGVLNELRIKTEKINKFYTWNSPSENIKIVEPLLDFLIEKSEMK